MFILMDEGVEFPSVCGGIFLAVGSEVLGRFIIQLELCLLCWVGFNLAEFAMSIRKSG